MSYKDIVEDVKKALERAADENLEPEVFATALLLVAQEEKYRNNIALALEDACLEWDI